MHLKDYLSKPIESWRLELIRNYSEAVKRYIPQFSKRYPNYDVEPLMFQALYLAAFTFNPDRKVNFFYWYKSKLLGITYRIRRQIKYRKEYNIIINSFDPKLLEENLYYEEEEKEEEKEIIYELPSLSSNPPKIIINSKNIRNSVLVKYKDRIFNLHKWSKITGISYNTLYKRYERKCDPSKILDRT